MFPDETSTDYAEKASIAPLIHIAACNVSLEMETSITFKLTTETVDALIAFHEAFHYGNVRSSWCNRRETKLHEDFVQAIHRFTFSTDVVTAREGLNEDGTGALPRGESEQVKNIIMGFMKVDVFTPPRVAEDFWQPLPAPPDSRLHHWISDRFI